MKHIKIANIFSLFLLSQALFAGTMGESIKGTTFYLGAGGSYNSTWAHQHVDITGFGQTNDGTGRTLAYGGGTGVTNAMEQTLNSISPEAQIGLLRHFNNPEYLWGIKLLYQHIGTNFTNDRVDVPQAGRTSSVAGQNTLFGNQIIGSYQVTMNEELALIGYVGESFFEQKGFMYLGIGPSLFDVATHLYDVVGFLNVNGTATEHTGKPATYSGSKWVWGGAAQLGVTYSPKPTWLLDFNYTYAFSSRYKRLFTGPFSAIHGPFTATGTVFIVPIQQFAIQTLNVSLNKTFEV